MLGNITGHLNFNDLINSYMTYIFKEIAIIQTILFLFKITGTKNTIEKHIVQTLKQQLIN